MPEDLDVEDVDLLASESYQARQRLGQLDEKIANKEQALSALRMSQKEDGKVRFGACVIGSVHVKCVPLRNAW